MQHVALASTDAKTIKCMHEFITYELIYIFYGPIATMRNSLTLSLVVAHLSGQGNALDMLSERVLIVKSYLQGIQNGTCDLIRHEHI